MGERFHVADLHLGHALMTRTLENGETLRPWGSTEEMDEELVRRWNAVVHPRDKVWLQGDVVMNRRCLPTVERLNGHIVLIMGNHDTLRATEYLKYFSDVKAAVQYDDWLLTHVPVHTCQLGRFKANVHGHMHAKRVMRPNPVREVWDNAENYGGTFGWGPRPPAEQIDPRYLCVSVEQTDYAPLHHDEVQRRLQEQTERYDRHG